MPGKVETLPEFVPVPVLETGIPNLDLVLGRSVPPVEHQLAEVMTADSTVGLAVENVGM